MEWKLIEIRMEKFWFVLKNDKKKFNLILIYIIDKGKPLIWAENY